MKISNVSSQIYKKEKKSKKDKIAKIRQNWLKSQDMYEQ